MKLFQDRQFRYFCCFLIFFLLILFGSGAWLFSLQIDSAKEMLYTRENTMISVLLEQGVSEDVIAAAVANTESGERGTDYLSKIGRTGNTTANTLPEFTEFRKEAGRHMVSAAAWLSVFLTSGVFMFLWRRDRLYQKAESIMQQYIAGDFSCHLPQTSEGAVYQMFSSMDQLATILQARGETQQKEKEFLKSTISDISHQLKTPLAALTMYQEIIAGEPENPDTVKEFSAKMGVSLKRIKQLIVGESGSGKSTLLNCIGALDAPSSGSVTMEGNNLHTMKEEERTVFRRRNIGFIFQSFQLVSELTVEQNIIFPILLDYRKPNEQDVKEILDMLGLTERRNHFPHQLSGGQQQRVAIGRALITRPKLILADEPTGNLDSKNSQDVMDLLTQAARHYQQTILMITHNNNLTASVDRVLRVTDGVLTDLGGNANERLS